MGKVLFYTRLFVLFWLLFSCGTNNFTKRKYMKGVYVAKHGGVSTCRRNAKTEKLNLTKIEKKKLKERTSAKKKIEGEKVEIDSYDPIVRSEIRSNVADQIEQVSNELSKDPKESLSTDYIPVYDFNDENKEVEKNEKKDSGLFWTGFALLLFGIILLALQLFFWELLLSLGLVFGLPGLVLIILGFLKKKAKKINPKKKGKFKNAAIGLWISFGVSFIAGGILCGLAFVFFNWALWFIGVPLIVTAIIMMVLAIIFNFLSKQKDY